MNPRLILFNGPPRSGKDFAAKVLRKDLDADFDVLLDRFSEPLKRAASGLMGLPCEFLEDNKDSWVHPTLNKTYRQMQIFLSEKILKPTFGVDVFGKLLVERVVSTFEYVGQEGPRPPLVLIPDSGFAEELEPVIEAFGPERILLVRLRREGTDFSFDSRGYVYPPKSVYQLDFANDGTEKFTLDVKLIARMWLSISEDHA